MHQSHIDVGALVRSRRGHRLGRSGEKPPLSFGIALVLTASLISVAWPNSAHAQQETAGATGWKYDPENAQDIMETCAACHGRSGQGGKDGEYPRIAGLDERYIARQLRAFKARKRLNIPMYPYATERELPPNDVREISRLLSEIELPTKMPPFDETMSALDRLRAAQAVFQIPRVEGGDVERGAEIYEAECSECHGEGGWGDDDTPQLAGQHTNYLRRQIANFQSGERVNEDMDGVFESINKQDLEDVFAYLASRDD